MSILNKEANGPWGLSDTTTKAGTVVYNFNTAGTFVDRNIGLSITTPAGSASTPATTITANPSLNTTKETNGYKISVSATKNITPTVSGGWVSSGTAGTVTVSGSAYIPAALGSVTMTAGNGTVSAKSNIEFWTTNNGIQVGGKGAVSATAKITTAGYTPTNNSFATGSSTSSNEATSYVKGVTLVAPTGDTPNTFYIKVPNGTTGSFITFNFKVDKNGNSWVEG